MELKKQRYKENGVKLEIHNFLAYRDHIDFLMSPFMTGKTGMKAAGQLRMLIKEHVESFPEGEQFKKEA